MNEPIYAHITLYELTGLHGRYLSSQARNRRLELCQTELTKLVHELESELKIKNEKIEELTMQYQEILLELGALKQRYKNVFMVR